MYELKKYFIKLNFLSSKLNFTKKSILISLFIKKYGPARIFAKLNHNSALCWISFDQTLKKFVSNLGYPPLFLSWQNTKTNVREAS
ncbi:hypothetical protein CL616_00425 [archaeon]|nr:hypothetical protein [archaeon]|tara:strand:+ start:477 stop:734 length:258 start_codon:yes stop_codon:yes gene_type:complete